MIEGEALYDATKWRCLEDHRRPFESTNIEDTLAIVRIFSYLGLSTRALARVSEEIEVWYRKPKKDIDLIAKRYKEARERAKNE